MQSVQEKSDEQYAAENDARTLADADVILADTKRVDAARFAAKRMVTEEIKDYKRVAARLSSLLKIANKTGTVEGMKIVEPKD